MINTMYINANYILLIYTCKKGLLIHRCLYYIHNNYNINMLAVTINILIKTVLNKINCTSINLMYDDTAHS